MTVETRPQAAQGRAGISENSLLGGRVRLLQPVEGYRVAIDPVFLAAAVPAKPGESVLDLGCGVGAAALCLLARVPEARVTGLEIDGELVRLASENARLNGVAGRFQPMSGDVAKPPLRLSPGVFDHVMCNPPHLPAAVGRPTDRRGRQMAMREGSARLEHWLSTALAMLRPKGSLTFVHRADRLDELLAALTGRAGEIAVIPLWPRQGQPAKRVIVRARKGLTAPFHLSPGLVLHEADGSFTLGAEAVLRGATALEL